MANSVVCAILIFAFFLTFYKYFKIKYGYWSARGVTTLPVLPFVGSYGELLRGKRHLAEITTDIYKKYSNEKYVGGYKALAPELFVMDPDVIKSILVRDFDCFCDRGMITRDREVISRHLFNLSGEKWRFLRSKLTPVFTSSKMRKMHPLLIECGADLFKHIGESLKISDVIEVKECASKYTTDTIGSCAFGLKMSATTDENNVFREMGRKIFEPSKNRIILRFLSGLSPKLADLLNVRFTSIEVETFFVDLVRNLIKERVYTAKRNDFIDLMIDLKDNEITDEIIAAQAFVFFLAGFETSSTTISYVLRQLALNPQIQNALFKEIETVLSKHAGIPSYDAVNEMKYLDMVVNETLRLHSPVAALVRQCTKPYTLPDTKINIDKGVFVMIPVYAIHHDERYFRDPEKFDPERFQNNPENPYTYLPFGEGPRNCIAMRFGKLQTAVGLISILRHYSVEACDRTPLNLKFEPTSPVLASADGIYLRFKPRE